MLAILNYGPTRHILTQSTAEALSKELNTSVFIEDIEVGLFNRLIINNIRIKDQQGKDILKAKLVTSKIELRSLFKEQLALRTISILDADIKLYQEKKNGPTNIQFIIDQFASKDKNKKSTLNLRINSLILRRVNISFNKYYLPNTPHRFNPSHINTKDINANLSLKTITPDSLDLRVRSFSFKEQSGFVLDNLKFRLSANRKHAEIRNFELHMPQTHIVQNSLSATYDALSAWENFWPSLRLRGYLDNAQISPSDIKAFVNIPQKLDLSIKLSTNYIITPSYIKLDRLHLSNTENLTDMRAQATLFRRNGRFTAYDIQLNHLFISKDLSSKAAMWLPKDTMLLNTIHRAGDIMISGNAFYNNNQRGKADVNIKSQVGLLAASAQLSNNQIRSDFRLTQANPAFLLQQHRLPKLVTLNGHATLDINNRKINGIQGNILISSLLWNNYHYKDITLNADYRAHALTAQLVCSDPNIDLTTDIKAQLTNNKLNYVKLQSDIQNIAPALLGIKNPYGQATFKACIQADLNNLLSNTPQGYLNINNFCMKDSPRGDYKVNQLNLTITPVDRQIGCVKLHSDFMDAEVRGKLSVKDLSNGGIAVLNRCLPGLLSKQAQATTDADRWIVKATLKDAEVIRKMVGVNLETTNNLTALGCFDATGKRSSLSVFTGGLKIDNQEFFKPSIYIQGEEQNYQCLIKGQRVLGGKPFDFIANLYTEDNCLNSKLAWNAPEHKGYKGALNFRTRFYHGTNAVNFSTDIYPTQFSLDGTVWNIASGNLSVINKDVAFNNIKISHDKQSLSVNGKLLPNQNDSIVASLQNIDIDYILELVNFHAVEFGGRATGEAIFTKNDKHPELHAKLYVPDFTFNHGPMGEANITGTWNATDNRIVLDADMRLLAGHDMGTHVDGYVSLAEKGLNLNIKANRTNLRFLRRYIDGIFDDFEGEATGSINLFGPFKELDFKGDLKARASARILATGVRYNVENGSVHVTPGEFAFKNFDINDGRKGTGTASGYLRHNHLKNLTYAFEVNAQHLLCYDRPQSHDMPFYSTTTGSGKVHLKGGPGKFTADINLRPEAPTTLVYTLGTQEAFSTEDRMIRFGTLKPNRPNTWAQTNGKPANNEEPEKEEESTTDIIMNFLIDTNPSAEVQIITDPRTGDVLTAYGQGPIRATFHNKGNFEMYGTYRLVRGSYKLCLQDVIRKNLSIQKGSTLTFGGNPLEADLGLKAVYTVNGVSLSDLNYGAGFSQKSAKVDCILNIGGKAKAPRINFDIDLHNISDDEKQMVRQLIATDEDLNRQVIYLLGIGRFYTANTQSGGAQTSTQQQSAAAMRSFLSTTLTGQLNTAISSVLGDKSHWSFGTNVAPGTLGWSDIEVDGLLQGRLFNDRLLINGNFGYRDRPTYTSNFVGDFDIRYLLTPKGSISLKAYSETTDRYFTKSSLTTQGIGITLQREFNNLKDLFNIRKRKKEPKTEKIKKSRKK